MIVALEDVVAASCSIVHAVDDSKKVIVGGGIAVEVGSGGIAAVNSMAAAGSETAAVSKVAQTRRGDRSTAKVHVPVVVVQSLLLLWWRPPSKTAWCQLCGQSPQ